MPNKDGSHAEELQEPDLQDKLKNHMHAHHYHGAVNIDTLHCKLWQNCMIRQSVQHSLTLTHSKLMQSPLLMPNWVPNSGPCPMWPSKNRKSSRRGWLAKLQVFFLIFFPTCNQYMSYTADLPLGLIEGMPLHGKMASVMFWNSVLFVCKTAEVIHSDRSSWLFCL